MRSRRTARIAAVVATVAIGIASSSVFASPLFCAVGWFGEFTHIDADVGQVPPTRSDLPSFQQALARAPDGTLYAGRSGDLYTIDPMTGDTQHFLSIDTDIRGMAFSPSGELYVTAGVAPQEFRIVDLATGSSSLVGHLWGGEEGAQGLAFSPDGVLYAVDPLGTTTGTHVLMTIDLDDLEMHVLGSYSTSSLGQSITFTPDGQLYAVGQNSPAGTSHFAELHPYDGSVIGPVFSFPGRYRGLAWVPEPTTLTLLALGCLALRRRRSVSSV